MTYTEFWDVLKRVFPDGRAQSVASDLVLPQLSSLTCAEALKNGYQPIEVWRALIVELDLPAEYEYLHRINPREMKNSDNR
ncbi:DUF3046 domain-containing protein [Arcanobacterium hippocoleae]|uniref:DUF3046 domain-containing protein n=1 Tax=Arcanobacterium hippocoleae TaxID=149017 RepID=A0ABU1T119_9ACTO|nr:DUF3046 domain-containing protein [Arcanobacterium hippocoleae]MDR6939028.1 hypothetical protein [Arcanobacterium hippocoleae]